MAMHLRALLIALGLYAAGALVWFAGPLAFRSAPTLRCSIG